MVQNMNATRISKRVIKAPLEKVAPYLQFAAIGKTPVFKDAFASYSYEGTGVGSTRTITLKEPAGAEIREM